MQAAHIVCDLHFESALWLVRAYYACWHRDSARVSGDRVLQHAYGAPGRRMRVEGVGLGAAPSGDLAWPLNTVIG